ncbi:MAG: hypothetical protein GKR91_03100 [Pseudomonadales bacterium]|nr:hypothetical protein [Pseudomonadales bacterium]
MSEHEQEALSALLDNEADDLELRRLLKSYESNPEMRETWERYNLAQALLHEEAIPVSSSLSARIQEQIDTEPALSTPRFSNWQQNLTKMAIAASVAAVFIVAVQTNLQQSPAPELANQAEAVAEQAALAASTLLAESNSIEIDPQAQQLLREYLSGIEIDEEEPPYVEHIQDSPLYRLVNELQAREDQ